MSTVGVKLRSYLYIYYYEDCDFDGLRFHKQHYPFRSVDS
jgi:hypothetical protein